MRRTLLIDGDVFAYKAACSCETEIQWAPDQFTLTGNLSEAKSAFEGQVEHYVEKLKADAAVICFSDPARRYWRHDIFPTYKMHRKGGRKPLAFFDLVTWIINESG